LNGAGTSRKAIEVRSQVTGIKMMCISIKVEAGYFEQILTYY
jgi:hypothetical protein